VSFASVNSGLAVAVSHAGRPLLVRGFGSARLGREDSDKVDGPGREDSDKVDGPGREDSGKVDGPGREDSGKVDGPVPVTEHTKFAVASLSKAFTSALIGILLKEQETRFALPPSTFSVYSVG